VVGLIDVLPTLVGLTGSEPPADVEGEDLSPFFRNEGPAGSGVVFSGATRTHPGLVALTAGPLKLIVDETTNRVALFNVIEDRAETRNLAEAMPGELRRMRSYLARLQQTAKQRPLFQPATQAPTAEHLELLQSLGYMN
jgi:arylsulfatase A-like enzyme